MTNVVALKPRAPRFGTAEIIGRLREMENHALVSHANITKCRTESQALAAYADFLHRYHRADGSLKSAFHVIDEEVKRHGGPEDPDRIDRLVEFLANAEDKIAGPNPWFSVPGEDRFRQAAMRTLGLFVGDLTSAISIAATIGTKPTENPKGAA